MAQLKLIVLIAVSLSVMVLGAEENNWQSLEGMSGRLWRAMHKEVSWQLLDQPEVLYSFAEKYFKGLKGGDAKKAGKLMEALDQFLHKPYECDERSLDYIAMMSKCETLITPSFLLSRTRMHAKECLTPEYIESKIKSQGSGRSSKTEVEFIDDRFIADYWEEHPGDKDYTAIKVLEFSKTIAKAIVRGRKNNDDDVDRYLRERLYKPCSIYWSEYEDLMEQVALAGRFYPGGYNKLISPLDEEIQKVVFRYHICESVDIRDVIGSFSTTKQVSSDLKNLAKS